MKIIKLPKEIDPNLLIEKQVSERYGICPICGETRKYDPKEEIKYLRQGSAKGIYGIKITTINTRYGKQRPIWKHLFGKNINGNILNLLAKHVELYGSQMNIQR